MKQIIKANKSLNYNPLKIKKEILLGLIGVITLLLFIWGVNFLKGKDLLMKQQRFYAIYPSVDGLIESHPVTIHGVKIGQVNKIRLHHDRSGRVVVECIVGDRVNIPVDSEAVLAPAGFLGGHQIILKLGSAQTLIGRADTLKGTIQPSLPAEIGEQLEPFKLKAESIITQIDSILMSVHELIDARARRHITQSFEELNSSLQNLSSITETIRDQENQISEMITNLSSFSDTLTRLELNETIALAQQTLDSMNQLMKQAASEDGSLGLLLSDDKLYNNLESSAKQLDILLEDIRNNPRKYINLSIFGK